MRYQVPKSEFEGVRCDLDGQLPTKDLVPDPRHRVLLILLAASLGALLITGVYGLATQSFVPLVVTWTACSPLLTLIVRKYIGPFDGWL